MMKWLGTCFVLLSFILIQACAPKSQEDCGFVQNVYGERISWKKDMPVELRLHKDVPENMVPAILSAAATWEKTAGRKLFNVVTTPRVEGAINPHKDGLNVIYFMTSWESNRDSEQGRTSVYWIGDLIKEADMRLNGADFGFYWKDQKVTNSAKWGQLAQGVSVNIEALVLHELGHVLGLKHKDNAGSVMATYLANGENRTQVTENDLKAIQCEY